MLRWLSKTNVQTMEDLPSPHDRRSGIECENLRETVYPPLTALIEGGSG